MQSVTALEAYQQTARSERAHYRADSLQGAAADVEVRPKFTLAPESNFFCIGSCFARNIEEHLIYRGVPVLSKRVVAPVGEWPGPRPNGILNKFTTASMLNEVEWALRGTPPPGFVEQFGGWVDLNLAPGTAPVSLERAQERRRYLAEDYFARIRRADVVIITLGLIEAWFDSTAGAYLNTPPSFWNVRSNPKRFEFHLLDVEANVGLLERLRSAIKQLAPAARIVITVSPVPLTTTFSGDDAVTANIRSKSTLRVAAEALSAAHDDVAYFPSFEMVTLAPSHLAYEEDRVHVQDQTVREVTARFMSAYLGLNAPSPTFNEIAYLREHPEVDAAVRRGELESGFQHAMSLGQAGVGNPVEDQPVAYRR